jgi:uracil-DNA glycosylase
MRLVDVRFLSGRYVRHGRPEGFQTFASTMTPLDDGSSNNISGGRTTTTTKQRQRSGREDHRISDAAENDGAVQGGGTDAAAPQEHGGHNVDRIVEWNAKGKFIYIVLDDGAKELRPCRGGNNVDTDDGEEDAAATSAAGVVDEGEDDEDYQRSLWITLGMTGQFVNESVHMEDPKYARWMLVLLDVATGRTHNIYYHDRRNFGTLRFSLSAGALRTKLASLGPDILDAVTTTEDVFVSIMESQKPTLNVCKFLTDQGKISGVGNYMLSEALYRARIDPFATLGELDDVHRRSLFRETQAVAEESYNSQGLTRPDGGTYRTYKGDPGGYAFQLQCYGRTVCANGYPVIHETEGPHKRSIWFVEGQLFKPRSERRLPSLSDDEMMATTGTDDDDRNDGTPKESSQGTERKNPTPVSPRPVGGGWDGNSGGGPEIGKGPPATVVTTPPDGRLLDGLTDPGWREALLEYATSSESFHRLERFLREEQESGAIIYPPPGEVFAAMNLCPLHRTHVVILGQDPYHGPNQAHGLAFSVRRGIPIPPSLKNVFREAMDDVGIAPPRHGNLECWSRRGVLLLNTVLTVRRGEANSHARRGWEEFTDEVVRILSEEDDRNNNDNNNDDEDGGGAGQRGKVFLLWGRPAAQKARNVDTAKHAVIQTSHPSPLGATKTATPFLTSKCFSRANRALVEMGRRPIDWNVNP